jgi:hypothetical protein
MSYPILNQSGWRGFPSGKEMIAIEIALSKAEIESRYGLTFISGSDSLGATQSTYFNDEALGPVTITCYERAPHSRAFVHIDAGLELKDAVPRLLVALGLDESLVNLPQDLI